MLAYAKMLLLVLLVCQHAGGLPSTACVVYSAYGNCACRVCIETRRCGGAFGGKFHSASHVAAGAGLAAQVMKR